MRTVPTSSRSTGAPAQSGQSRPLLAFTLPPCTSACI
jgi:hypothetical protein